MPRIARLVVPGLPHHVTQRGVRRMHLFFSDADRADYVGLMAEQGARFGVRFLSWCLMDNHIHLIAVPRTRESLAQAIGEAHKRYSRRLNARNGWRGYLFQGRFFSCPLEGSHTVAAIRYVLRNPVRAGFCAQAWEYDWSNARWLVGLKPSDPLAVRSSLFEEIDDWRALLQDDPEETARIRKHTRTGRPLCTERFLGHLERTTGRTLRPNKRGRPPSK